MGVGKFKCPFEGRLFVFNEIEIMKIKLSQFALTGIAVAVATGLVTGCGHGAAQQQMPPPNVTVAPVVQKENKKNKVCRN